MTSQKFEDKNAWALLSGEDMRRCRHVRSENSRIFTRDAGNASRPDHSGVQKQKMAGRVSRLLGSQA